jgi:SAM-dependent methyltransferase
MCGTGRFLVPLVRRGVEMVGTDASEAMLAVCRDKLAAEELKAETRLERAEALEEVGRYAAVIVPAGSIDLVIGAEQQLGVFRRIRRALRPGGRLVFDGSARRAEADWDGNWGGRWVATPDGGKLIISWLSRYRAATGVVESVHRYEHVVGSRVAATEMEDFRLMTMSIAERDGLLREAGFGEVRHWKPHRRIPADGSEEEVVFEAVAEGVG